MFYRPLPAAARPVPAERESLRKREPVPIQQQLSLSQTKDMSSPAITAVPGEDDVVNEVISRTSPSSEASSPGSVSEVLAKRGEERLRFLESFRVEQRQRSANPDDEVFWSKCKQLRSEFTHDDHLTNPGTYLLLISSRWCSVLS